MPEPGSPAAGRGVIDGAFQLLRAVPQTVPGRQVAQLVRRTGLPRPTVHRLLGQLREAGAVDLVDGHWVLAADLLRLARHVEPHAGLRESAADILRALRAGTGAAASLVVPEQDAYVVLETVPGHMSLPVGHRPGDQLPAFTASGRVLVSPELTGVSADHTAVHEGFTCYAVPVLLPEGRRAALQLASVDPRPADRFAPQVHRAARALQRLTARPG
ncbi:IclR family transcriptional regulator [Symbioplanes lichenis]|uniref:IclR family transcriptional regulator n=1 Tax=Symbioplanes lichenis TaxID=1629072 RepID=UPI0027392A2F|nr:helix-turn-helix domain-containing protein [Actinoplanes lichenis]